MSSDETKQGNMAVPKPVLLYSLLLTLSFQGLLESCLSKEIACLHDPAEFLEIACPMGKVILQPKVKVGKMASKIDKNKCVADRDRDCLGTTPEVIVQTNQCHFSQVCRIHLNQFMPMTNSNKRSCLAKEPDYAIVESFECICQQTLQYVCKDVNDDQMVAHMEGTLVSHRNYPWNYRTDGGLDRCRLSFIKPMQPGFVLNMWTTDLDLDPDFRDQLFLYNRTITGGKPEVIGHYPSKSSKEHGFNLTFVASSIEVVFSRTRYSKSGRGFVIKYKWIPIGGEVTPTEAPEICLENTTLPQVTVKPKKKHRRKKGKGRHRKRKGKKNRKKKTDKNTKDENTKQKKKRKGKGKKRKPKKPVEKTTVS